MFIRKARYDEINKECASLHRRAYDAERSLHNVLQKIKEITKDSKQLKKNEIIEKLKELEK